MYSFAQPEFRGRIGVAREEITPPVGIYARNWGAAMHDTAEGVHRPLTLTALSLQSEDEADGLLLISADLGWWRTVEDERLLRQGLLDALNLSPTRLLIALSHTHSGPSLCREDSDKPGGDLIAPYLDSVLMSAVNAARAALSSAQTAVLTWNYGRCALAKHRDLPDPEEERVLCGFHPGVPADDTLLVGRIADADGRTLATLVNYACHPVTLAWENRLISPDYIGAMREIVETGTQQAPCLFLQGASGELAPREEYTDDTGIADSNGRQLGYAVLAALEGMLPPATGLNYTCAMESGAPLAVWRSRPREVSQQLEATRFDVEIPLKEMPSLQTLEAEVLLCSDRVLKERLVRKRRIRQALGEGDKAKMPCWAWRIGDTLLIAQPNEAYSSLQTTLRQRFSDRPVAVLNVTNGPYCGYLPPESIYNQDLYQVWQSPFAAGCLEITVEACSQALKSLTE
jgi:hypothetical protein